MLHCNQSILPPPCAATSVGTANQLFLTLIQSLTIAQCNISPPSKWPKDYGKTAKKHGIFENYNE